MYLGDIYTISVNLAGLPGMTVPCGKDSKGLPIGLQLIGDCFKEKNIIRAGYAYECSRSYETPELAKAAEAKLDGEPVMAKAAEAKLDREPAVSKQAEAKAVEKEAQ